MKTLFFWMEFLSRIQELKKKYPFPERCPSATFCGPIDHLRGGCKSLPLYHPSPLNQAIRHQGDITAWLSMQHKLTQNNLKCRGIAINAAPTPNPATGQCTNCHISQNLTANNYCGMCHAYATHPSSTKSTINVTATADKASYAPGEAMVVTISGGYRARTARAVVFDGPNPTTAVQKAISTGTLDPVGGAPINAPAWTGSAPATIVLSGFTAPTVAGTYTWYGAWYGNDYDLGIIGGTTTFGLWTADPGSPGRA